jgi:hypothetical protein
MRVAILGYHIADHFGSLRPISHLGVFEVLYFYSITLL